MSINELHYFLWCSHGGTVAAENNLYDVETGVHSVMFYGDQFDTIDSNLLSDAFDYDNNQKPKFTGFDKDPVTSLIIEAKKDRYIKLSNIL